MEIPYRCEIYFHIYAKLFTQWSKRGGEEGKSEWRKRYKVGVAAEIGQMRWFSRLHDARTTSAAWPVKIITLKLILFMRMCVYYVCSVCTMCVCVYYVCVCLYICCICTKMCNAIIVEVFAMKAACNANCK